MGSSSCELLGRWHLWHTIERVMDGPEGASHGLDHAVRVMRCERCGAHSWRWTAATEPASPGSTGDAVRTVVHVRRTAPRPVPA